MKYTSAVSLLALATVAIAAPTIETEQVVCPTGTVSQICCNNIPVIGGLSCLVQAISIVSTCSANTYCCSNSVGAVGLPAVVNVNTLNCVKVL